MILQSAKKNLFLLAISTILSIFSAFSILSFTDPEKSSKGIFFGLYFSIFLAILGLCLIVQIMVRQRYFEGVFSKHFFAGLRQSFFISLLFVSLLFLSSQGLLYWWVALSLIALAVCLEIFLSLKI